MEEIQWINDLWAYIKDNALISSVLIPAAAGLVGTGFLSQSRSPKKVSQGGSYFISKELLSPPITRPAYSDRMAYVLAEMSSLAYFEFEGSGGALQKAIDNFTQLSKTAGGGDQDDSQVRGALKAFADDLLVKSVDSEEFLKQILKQRDFDLLGTVNVKNTQARIDTQAFVCKRVKAGETPYIVVAYRGTELEVADWLTDARAEPTSGKQPDSRVHSGFMDALTSEPDSGGKNALGQIEEILAKPEAMDGDKPFPRFITGHSLGGALALLTTCEIASEIIGACYTYGAPRVANYEYFRYIKTPVFRVVNSSDIVPRVPPGAIMGLLLKLIQGLSWVTHFLPVARDLLDWLEHKVDMLNGYRHYGDQRFLTDIEAGRFDTVRLLSNPPLIDRIMWMWQHIRLSLFAPVKSHGMAIYRDKLEYLANSRNRKSVHTGTDAAQEGA